MIRFIEEAQREFLDAIVNYEEARAGLGRRFKDEVDRCVLWIEDHPELYRLRPGGYHRVNLRVFPYYIPYVVRGEIDCLDSGCCARQPKATLLDFQA